MAAFKNIGNNDSYHNKLYKDRGIPGMGGESLMAVKCPYSSCLRDSNSHVAARVDRSKSNTKYLPNYS